jgi:hypothetical protein
MKYLENCKYCHFFQVNKCILHKNWFIQAFSTLLCSWKMRTIDGISDNKDYLVIIASRLSSHKALAIAIVSLIISSIMLLIKAIEMLHKMKNS